MAPKVKESTKKKPSKKEKLEEVKDKVIKNKKIKYFIEANVNIKGQRKKIGRIIKAINEDKALLEYDKTVKKEYSGVRNITNKNIRLSTESDIEYSTTLLEETEEVIKNNTISKTIVKEQEKVEEDLDDLDDTDLFEAAKHLDKTIKAWKIVYTPGRKPRKRDLDDYIYALGNSLEDAKHFIANRIEIDVNMIKDKWMIASPIQISDIIKEDKRFRQFLKDNINLLGIEHKTISGKEFVDNHSEVEKCLQFEGLDISFRDDNSNYIEKVNLKGVSIFQKEKLKWFIAKPDNTPAFRIQSTDIVNVAAECAIILKKLKTNLIYSKTKNFRIFSEDLKDGIMLTRKQLLD